MDRDIAIKVKNALNSIEEDFADIATALEVIAENTTPTETPAAQSNVNDSRVREESEEQEETKGGNK